MSELAGDSCTGSYYYCYFRLDLKEDLIMRFKKIVKMFEDGNVCITGLRGTGKDLLMSNVVVRRKEPYVSNIDYGGFFAPLDFDKINLGENDYRNFMSGNIYHYEFPYARGSDVYISDVGVYLPSQHCNELNRDYKYLPAYLALCRQVSHNNTHINVQNLNRAWDKVREQSDIYIRCRRCIYIPIIHLVFQQITIYDKYESCVNRIAPCRVTSPILNPQGRATVDTYRDNFFNTHGSVKNRILIYRNRSKYDTYHFEKLLKEAKNVKKTNSKN